MTSVDYEELNDSPRFTGSYKGLTATRHWKVAWSDINNLYLQLFPPAVLGIPTLPARYDGSYVLFANEMKVKPFVADPGAECVSQAVTNWNSTEGFVNAYQWADVEIVYKTIPYQSSANQLYTFRWSQGNRIKF